MSASPSPVRSPDRDRGAKAVRAVPPASVYFRITVPSAPLNSTTEPASAPCGVSSFGAPATISGTPSPVRSPALATDAPRASLAAPAGSVSFRIVAPVRGSTSTTLPAFPPWAVSS